MNDFYKKLINEPVTQKKNTIWYSIGSICSSSSSMLILLIVTRILGEESSGIFSLSWSAAQLMLTIGWFSMRQYQVSDIKEIFSFFDYYYAKIISSVLMILCGIIYTSIYKYSNEQRLITLLLCLLMICEVFADLYSGFFQQKGKLHIAGKSYMIRNIMYLCCFAVSLAVWKKMEFAIVCAIIISGFVLYHFDRAIRKKMYQSVQKMNIKKSFLLFKECFPLFLGSFVTSFIMNIPKNAINTYMNNSIQACYNILFMPSAVINLFTMFLCVPYYDKLAILWNEEKNNEFKKMIGKMIFAVSCLTVIVMVGGVTLGIPILSIIYGVDLYNYRVAFLLLLFGGGCTGIISILTYTITVMRKQRLITAFYIATAIVVQSIAGMLVKNFGIIGAAALYALAMIILVVSFLEVTIYWMKRERE